MPIQRVWGLAKVPLLGCSLGVLLLAGCVRSSDPASAPMATEQVGARVVVDTDDSSAPVDPGCPDPSAPCAAGPEPPPPEPLPASLPGPPPEEVRPLQLMSDAPPPEPAPNGSPKVAPAAVQGKVGGSLRSRPQAGTKQQGQSRPARLKGGSSQCDFPPIAKQNGVSAAKVTLRVEVSPQGRVTRSTAQYNPGFDFLAAARACLHKMRFSPALDAQGHPTASTIPITVQFRN